MFPYTTIDDFIHVALQQYVANTFFLFLQMYADDVVKMRSMLIPFQVRVKWSEEEGEPLKEISYDTVIIGAKRHRIRVVSPDECISKLLPVVIYVTHTTPMQGVLLLHHTLKVCDVFTGNT